jgi:isoquinoline 1-oxidoreductase beta subunit
VCSSDLAGAAWLQAGLDAEGRVVALKITSAGDAITPRFLERNAPGLAGPVDLPDRAASEGLFDLPYAVPERRIAHVATRSGVPVGNWRSVGHSHNAFFAECFVDELAHTAGRDPVAFRLAMLDGLPRHAAVLRLAADRAGWASAPPPGTARGVALHESFGSIVAQVVELRRVEGRAVVRRVVCAADVGTIVNPGIVAQQMESAIVFGLSAALYGRIDIVGSVVQQTNFPSHPILTLAQTPRIETHLIASTNPPGGVGEPGTPPLAPALANALFALTGERQRALPLVA